MGVLESVTSGEVAESGTDVITCTFHSCVVNCGGGHS